LGNDAKGNYSSHEEGHDGSFFMMRNHAGFTIEVFQDHVMGSTRIVKKCSVTNPQTDGIPAKFYLVL